MSSEEETKINMSSEEEEYDDIEIVAHFLIYFLNEDNRQK